MEPRTNSAHRSRVCLCMCVSVPEWKRLCRLVPHANAQNQHRLRFRSACHAVANAQTRPSASAVHSEQHTHITISTFTIFTGIFSTNDARPTAECALFQVFVCVFYFQQRHCYSHVAFSLHSHLPDDGPIDDATMRWMWKRRDVGVLFRFFCQPIRHVIHVSIFRDYAVVGSLCVFSTSAFCFPSN